MDWAASSRWRKALVISFLFHSLVLTSVGWMAGKALLPEKLPETLIELELTNEPDSPQVATAIPEQRPASAEPVRNLPQPPVHQPAAVAESVAEPVIAEPVVAVSSMAVESVDTSAIAPVSAGAASGGGESAAAVGPGEGQSAGGNSGGSAGNSREVTPPGILSRREPAYPEQARQGGVEGTVVLRIEILENGHAGEVSIAESSGSELLDAAAVDAVQRWRFVPAKVRGTGQRIACQTTMPVVFKLRA